VPRFRQHRLLGVERQLAGTEWNFFHLESPCSSDQLRLINSASFSIAMNGTEVPLFVS
jgi:hypothetical protein